MSEESTSLMNKVKNWIIQNPAMLILVIILLVMTWGFFCVGFTKDGGEIAKFFGIDKTNGGKKETIEFIAFGMSGVIAAIVAVAVNRRASAQEQNNELIEKGHDNERFQNMINDLGHRKVTVRIATFYRFYYMAKKEYKSLEKTNQFREDVFEILCTYLHAMSGVTPNPEKKNEHQMERQTLFNVLFKEKFKSKSKSIMNDNFSADLRNINLPEMDFSDANFSKVNFSNAKLLNANLFGANLSGADLSKADLSEATLTLADLSGAKLSCTTLSKAKLLGTNLSNATIQDMSFSDTGIIGTRFINAKLAKVHLSDMTLIRANFSNAMFRKVNLAAARLFFVNFSNAKLQNANFSSAYFSNVNFSGANFSGADFQETKFKDVNLMEVSSVKGADFRKAKIDNRPITKDDLPVDKGEYYADWNLPPEEQGN